MTLYYPCSPCATVHSLSFPDKGTSSSWHAWNAGGLYDSLLGLQFFSLCTISLNFFCPHDFNITYMLMSSKSKSPVLDFFQSSVIWISYRHLKGNMLKTEFNFFSKPISLLIFSKLMELPSSHSFPNLGVNPVFFFFLTDFGKKYVALLLFLSALLSHCRLAWSTADLSFSSDGQLCWIGYSWFAVFLLALWLYSLTPFWPARLLVKDLLKVPTQNSLVCKKLLFSCWF